MAWFFVSDANDTAGRSAQLVKMPRALVYEVIQRWVSDWADCGTIPGCVTNKLPGEQRYSLLVSAEYRMMSCCRCCSTSSFCACGMLTAFALSAAVFIGGHYLARSDQAGQQPDSRQQPLPWLPGAAAGETFSSSGSAAGWLKDASLRLEALSALPPDWHLRYGQDLINQAYALWPGLPETEELGTQWRQKLALNGTPDDSLAGWHQGMHRLQSLSEQLNALDGQKGRYLTVSELKSQVFAAIQAFNQSVPAEEQLRQIAARQEPGMIPQAQKLEVEQHLQQLIIRYSALTNRE